MVLSLPFNFDICWHFPMSRLSSGKDDGSAMVLRWVCEVSAMLEVWKRSANSRLLFVPSWPRQRIRSGSNFLPVIIIPEMAMAAHSSTLLAWKIPWAEEPGGLQSMGSRRVGHNWVTSLSLFTFMPWRRKWQPTPVFLPGESQGWGSLAGCCHMGLHRVGHGWSDSAAAAAA